MAKIFKSLRLSRLINKQSLSRLEGNLVKYRIPRTNIFYLVIFLLFILSLPYDSESTGLGLLSAISPEANLASATSTRINRFRRDGFSTLQDAEHLLPTNYSIHEPPPPGDDGTGSTDVDFYILIVGIRNIQEVTEEIQVELNLQLYWKDTRLSHLADKSGNKFVVLNPVLIQQIWHPDIFIDHVIKIEQPKLISTPASLRIYPDSTIRYSGRLTITMACSFDFHYYPADTQRCDIEFKSYAYSDKILKLDWREHKEAAIKKNLKLPNFIVGLGNTQNFTVQTSSGHYSAISFTIILRRLISYHMIQTYLPSGLFIIVSWLSFLVSPESIPGRMTLCITTLLTITAMFASVRQSVPNVSYVKAVDIWMVTCILFVFFTLLEYTIILKLKSIKHKAKKEKKSPLEHATQHVRKISNGNVMNGTRLRQNNNMRDKSSNTPTWVKEEDLEAGGDTNNGGSNGVCYQTTTTITNQLQPSAIPPTTNVPTPAAAAAPPPSGSPHEDIITKIEFVMSKLIPTCFVIFNFVYWPWLIIAADYFNEDEFDKTNFAL